METDDQSSCCTREYRIGDVSSISFGLGKWFESVGEVCPGLHAVAWIVE